VSFKLNNKILLDTSALIALLNQEPGCKMVEEILVNSAISSVNLCELISILAKHNLLESEIEAITSDVVPEIIPFCKDIAIKAGKLTKISSQYGLSLGDRACIATAEYCGMDVYSTDKIWSKLDDKVQINIVIIR
jgi:PIN domain nuclease of toxin-antitoxin system